LATGVVELRLDRPEAKNAMGKEMPQELRIAIEEVGVDVSTNVVFLASSVPKIFCAGADRKVPASPSVFCNLDLIRY
jgi:methylglutaconyl-CoA hydratase